MKEHIYKPTVLIRRMATQIQIIDELKSMKKEIYFIKKHMVDVDSILTEDDYRALQEYRRDKHAGNLTSHDTLKKELGV